MNSHRLIAPFRLRRTVLTTFVSALTLTAMSAFGVACEQVRSSDVKTSGVYANIVGEATGDGSTTVKAALRVGGVLSNTFLDLSEGESLSAKSGDEEKPLVRKSLPFGAIEYRATFTGDEEGKAFTVSWTRNEGYESAPNTTFTMPAGFNLEAPAAGATFSRAHDDIQITWSPSGTNDEMLWEVVTSSCAREKLSNVIDADDGSFTIPAGTLEAIEGHASETCDTTLVLVRRRKGDLDPAYGEGGWVAGRQVRKVTFSSAP